jgi:hypothetical protein
MLIYPFNDNLSFNGQKSNSHQIAVIRQVTAIIRPFPENVLSRFNGAKKAIRKLPFEVVRLFTKI